MSNLLIQTLEKPSELKQAVELQKLYWGTEGEALVPSHMLLSIARYGGHVLGAYLDEKLVGILMGFLGTRSAANQPAAENLLIMSKRMVVLPEYRGQQIGYQLKLAQREIAIQQNVSLVTWTYDPLLARNAYLNIHKLGCVSTIYKPDYFGAEENNPTLSADRLVVDLWVESQNVTFRLKEGYQPTTYANYIDDGAIILNQTMINRQSFIEPQKLGNTFDSNIILLEIPFDYLSLNSTDSQLGSVWRDHVRDAFVALMSQNYGVHDFVRQQDGESNRVYYVFAQR